MNIDKPVRLSLPKQIASEIEKEIKNGNFKVGEKIPSEPELVSIFEVSRNTIREAIQSLIQAGVLEARQGKGTYVLASERFEANMIMRLSHAEENDILEVRRLVEKEIVKLAAKRRTEEDIRLLEEALKNRNSNKSDMKENTSADIDFHIAIAKASHNEIFYDLYKYISKFIHKNILYKVQLNTTKECVIDSLHTQLYDAIVKKDVIEAENIINKILDI